MADYLKSNALPRGAVPNDTWGHGFAQLPSLAPGPPTGVTATAGDRQATVSWSAPAADGGSTVTGYAVTSSPGGLTAAAGASNVTTTVTGLTNTTTYTFTVTATNGVGTSTPSGPSSSVTPIGPPDPPTNATAVAGITAATVTWSAPGSDGGSAITGYTVTSSPGGLTAAVGGSTLTATVTGLTKGTSYTFTVTAGNALGTSSPSVPSNAVTPANASPVAQPSGSLAVAEGATLNAQLASFTDADASDVHTATVDWGDGDSTSGTVAQSAGSGTVGGSHVYSDDGTFSVTVTVSDGAGGLATTTVTVTASNVAPTVDAGPDLNGLGPGRVSVPPVTFIDPGPADTHTAVVDWGDGVVEAVPVDQQAREVELIHFYVSAGTYVIDVTVTDDDSGAGSDSLEIGVAVAPTTVNMPGVTSWGLLALAGVLVAALVLRLRRRAAGSESWVPGG